MTTRQWRFRGLNRWPTLIVWQFQQGVDEAVLRNIEATAELAEVVRTSMGPNGNYLWVDLQYKQW